MAKPPPRSALIVGINAYRGMPLTTCVSDAKRLASLLDRDEDGAPNFSVNLLTAPDDVITERSLKREIVSLFEDEHCDAAVFYFAGHGVLTPTGGYLVTPDFETFDEGISMDEVIRLANRSPIENKIIIMDCCHAGGIGDDRGVSEVGAGVSVIASCGKAQKAEESGDSSRFTSLLLDALQGGAADLEGYVTPASAYAYIDRLIGVRGQRPIFRTNVSNFFSIRRTSPPIEDRVLRKLAQYFTDADSTFALDPSFEPTADDADETNTAIFFELQQMNRVGLVKPVDALHMYDAAMNSGACALTATGTLYWRAAKDGNI